TFPGRELHARAPSVPPLHPLVLVDRLPAGVLDEVDAALAQELLERLVRLAREHARLGVCKQPLDRLGRALLVRADDAARTALDPAGDVDAGPADDAAAVVRDRAPALVERQARQRHAVVADRAEDEARRNQLDLVGRHGADRAALARLEPVPDDLDRLDPPLAEDLHGRDAEAEPHRLRPPRRLSRRELAQDLEVAPRRLAPVLERRRAGRVELELGGNDACAGPRRPSTTISRMPDAPSAAIASSVASVGASSPAVSASMRATSSATLPFPTTTARSPERSNSRFWKSGWALYQATNSVAAHEPGRSSPGIPRRRSVCAPTV